MVFTIIQITVLLVDENMSILNREFVRYSKACMYGARTVPRREIFSAITQNVYDTLYRNLR
jgi:hypothetical protein